MAMTEDDVYRQSTQYRLWSFTPETLASLRARTNALATERVRAAIDRATKAKTAGVESGDTPPEGGDVPGRSRNGSSTGHDIQCLAVEEEQKLVNYYCVQAMALAEDYCKLPTNVKATAIQYLRRFYLSNSPMTYHPKTITPCALFLATKTENHYTSLKSFAAKLPNTAPEDVIAAELLITQSLRFTLDVKHPFRALEGGFMELLALAEGKLPGGQEAVDRLREMRGGNATREDVKNRIREAHGKAKDILKTSAQLTDAYFLYTPAQIWMASLMVVDEPLATVYLDAKFALDDLSAAQREKQLSKKTRIIATLRDLAALLRSAPSVEPSKQEHADLKAIAKKLYHCQNPDKVDLVRLNQAQKREGGIEGALDEKALKKRKLERERLAQDEQVFGGELGK
ncbi:MAG: hypothetical protein M1817_006333 [Caeruleum heppii]|nr:MAG: hypothetical protein M1817_006333 [Caeruleum heppii]